MLYGGVVVDKVSAKTDFFYYEIPPFLIDKAEVGCRVAVPFGEKNETHSGYILKITTVPPPVPPKRIIDVIEEPLFSEKMGELFIFTSDNFLIPMHPLLNNLARTIAFKKIQKVVTVKDSKALTEEIEKATPKKGDLLSLLSEKKSIPYTIVRKRFGSSISSYLEELEKRGVINIKYLTQTQENGIFKLKKYDEDRINKLLQIVDGHEKRGILEIIKRLRAQNEGMLDEITLTKRIRNKKHILELLANEDIIEKVNPKIERKEKVFSVGVINDMTLEKRSREIIKSIKENLSQDECALVIFPEVVLLETALPIYKEAFGDKLAFWEGKGKLEFLQKSRAGKSVILSTPFSLFIDLPNLSVIFIEDANSRYFKPSEFLSFDVRTIAIKRARLENIPIIFSSTLPEEHSIYLKDKGEVSYKVERVDTIIKIIDMRREFKRKNISMLSFYLEKRTKDILSQNGNVALLINRRPYSTFVMCRECGYVIKCPHCKTSLYFDKESGKLYCPVCGFETVLPNVCPRCQSINIHFYGGGIQKLEEELERFFKHTNILKLMSGDKKRREPVDSNLYRKTIFLGTDFMVSHLLLDNVKLFGFVSIDTFLQHYSYDSAMETFNIFAKIAMDMEGKEVIAQTYLPEHYAIRNMKKMDFESFTREEMMLRKELAYPPYKNLINLSAYSKKHDDKELRTFLAQIKSTFQDEVAILGPAPSIEKGPNAFEATIKTALSPSTFKKDYINFLNSTSLDVEARVIPSADLSLTSEPQEQHQH